MTTPQADRGSTLFEMIVVLAIVSLLFGLAVPALSGMRSAPLPAAPADSALLRAIESGNLARVQEDSGWTIVALPDGRVFEAEVHAVR